MRAVYLIAAFLSCQAWALSPRYIPPPYWTCASPFCEYTWDQRVFDEDRDRKNPLLAPPTNLAAGDGNTTLATKILTSRLDILNNQIKDLTASQLQNLGAVKSVTATVNNLNTKIQKVTNQSMELRSSLCDVKSSMNYDATKNMLVAKSICDTYTAQTTYSVLSSTYETSLSKQLQPTLNVGVKSTSMSNSGLVFLQGSW